MANKKVGFKWGQLSNLKNVAVTPGTFLIAENSSNTTELYCDNENGTRKKVIDNDTPLHTVSGNVSGINNTSYGTLKDRTGKVFLPKTLASQIVTDSGSSYVAQVNTNIAAKSTVTLKDWSK